MDFEKTKAFIWNLGNYFYITGLTKEKKQARLAITLFIKNVGILLFKKKRIRQAVELRMMLNHWRWGCVKWVTGAT